MEGTLRRVRSPPAALWTETLDNLWRINWFLRSFSLWARHPAETSAELNVRSGAAEFFPVTSRQVRRGRKRRREGNEWAAQGTARVERRYTIQRTIRWLKNRYQVGPTILLECPAQIPRSSLRSFSLWATPVPLSIVRYRKSSTLIFPDNPMLHGRSDHLAIVSHSLQTRWIAISCVCSLSVAYQLSYEFPARIAFNPSPRVFGTKLSPMGYLLSR